MKKILRARAPAKLILTGEHAVVYGKSAIAMAINKYTETEVNWSTTSSIIFNLLNLETVTSTTISTLKTIRKRLSRDYNEFLAGKCTIRDVLKKPFELLQFSVSNLIEHLNLHLPNGLEIKVNSSIPMGCGLGSSSALVISSLYAIIKLLGLDVDYSKFLNMSKEAENLQHGKSSGLDLHLSAYGGVRKFANGKTDQINNIDFPLYMVNTGKPISSTGECVTHAAKILQDKMLLREFESTIQAIENSIMLSNLDDFKTGIKSNHNLLTNIGVVPELVQNFISEIEQHGGASKICGAGSIAGNSSGVALVVGEEDRLQYVADKYGYNLEKIVVDNRGAAVV